MIAHRDDTLLDGSSFPPRFGVSSGRASASNRQRWFCGVVLPLLKIAPQIACVILLFWFDLDTYSLGIVGGVCLMGMYQTVVGS